MSISFADALPLLWETAVKTSVLLVAAGVLTLAFRRASAASRFLTWQLGIVGVLGLTVASFVITPRWDVLPVGPSYFARTASLSTVDRAPNAIDLNAAPSASPMRSAPTPPSHVPPPDDARGTSNSLAPRTAPRLSLAADLELLWLAGVAFILLRLLIGTLGTRWLTRRATPVNAEEWTTLNETMSLALGLAHPVAILKSARATTPMTFGVFEPVVLLPSNADEWPDERRRVVLLHELAHVRRFDCFTNVLATATCALYWFNPLVWFAVHRMKVEGECACDDWVLRAGVKASSYADHLLDLVHTLGNIATPATALPMAQRSTFEGRLLAILEPHMNRNGVRRGQAALLAATIAAIALPLSAMTTATRSPNTVAAQAASSRDSVAKPVGNPVAAPKIAATSSDQSVGSSPKLAEATAQTSMSASAIDALIVVTKDSDSSVRLAAIKSLAESGDPRAVAALSEALRSDKDPAVRRAAAWGLGNLGDAKAVPALGAALKSDADVEVRRTATWALGEIGDKAASPEMIAALGDRDGEVRKEAVWALGEVGDHAAAPAIEHILNDKDPSVREQAAWALGEIGARESAPAIEKLIHDTSAVVRNEAMWALGEMGDRPAANAIASVATSDPDERVRETAVWALGESGDQDAVPALATAVTDASSRVAATAAWALGEISPHVAPPTLLTAVSNANIDVRRNAVWALAQIEDPASVATLRQALHDSDADVRRSAMRALARTGDAAAEGALADMLKDPDPSVRKEAAAALGGRNGGWPEPRPRPRPQPRPQPRPFGW